jgi:hypothetical protein
MIFKDNHAKGVQSPHICPALPGPDTQTGKRPPQQISRFVNQDIIHRFFPPNFSFVRHNIVMPDTLLQTNTMNFNSHKTNQKLCIFRKRTSHQLLKMHRRMRRRRRRMQEVRCNQAIRCMRTTLSRDLNVALARKRGVGHKCLRQLTCDV